MLHKYQILISFIPSIFSKLKKASKELYLASLNAFLKGGLANLSNMNYRKSREGSFVKIKLTNS